MILKMKKLFLITIILLLQSFPSFGNPNGKGIICKCEEVQKCPKSGHLFHNSYITKEEIPSEIGIIFEKNYATTYYIIIINDKISLLKEPKKYGGKYSFRSTEDIISWNENYGNNISVNRKTLIYKLKDNMFKKTYFRKCKSYNSDQLIKEMLNLVKFHQNNYNKRLSDNKI
tara:strand:+ start:156 stop:671 length:516 start_codon:yes stop_codon:yes gene_type:complete